MTRVTLVEDEALLRGMLATRLCQSAEIQVVAALSGATEAELSIRPGSTDVALLDINLGDGDGITLGRLLQERDPDLRVVLLSSHDVMGSVTMLHRPGGTPWSYLSKRSAFAYEILDRAIAAAARGEVVLDPYLVARSVPRSGTSLARLTPTQFVVLKSLAEGLSNLAIADRLDLSPRSVESHVLAIYRRLGIDDKDHNRRVSAVLQFLQQTGRTWVPDPAGDDDADAGPRA